MTSALSVLRLFNEKADKLASLSFAHGAQEERFRLRVEHHNASAYFVFDGPTEEQLDAFLLTLRFFVQDRELISLRRIADVVRSLLIPTELQQIYLSGRARLNAELDHSSPITYEGRTLSQRELFEIVLWGSFAHANPGKKAAFDRLFADTTQSWLIAPVFVETLQDFLAFVRVARENNLAIIAYLEASTLGADHT